ncbi:MAG TPA: hypothetical protein VGF13_23110, partial [Verrucomicrobiae bacterium]
MSFRILSGCVLFAGLAMLRADILWVEGERPAASTVTRHPWWYDKVKTNELSGGDFISHWDKDKTGEAEYRFHAAHPGKYDFWVRANPIQASLSYALNGGPDTPIALAANHQSLNIAADDK